MSGVPVAEVVPNATPLAPPYGFNRLQLGLGQHGHGNGAHRDVVAPDATNVGRRLP